MWVKVVENFRTNQELMRRKPDSWIIRRGAFVVHKETRARNTKRIEKARQHVVFIARYQIGIIRLKLDSPNIL